jgi:hypothetical protein
MSISAMKQAVKALEFAAGLISPITKGCQCQICLAHTALRQAIKEAKKQEPVAWMFQHEKTGAVQCELAELDFEYSNPRWKKIAPLYPAPVAQCTNSDSWNCKYCRKTETCEALKDSRNFGEPVHASDISQERVDETAKYRHDLWIAAACLKSTVESAIKAGDWKVDGACDPTRDLAYLADCLANPKHEWVEQPDLARVGEVGVWGDKWVGLTDEEIKKEQYHIDWTSAHTYAKFARAIEAKLKEKNYG